MPNNLLNVTREQDLKSNESVGLMSIKQSTITFAGAPVSVTLISQVLNSMNASWHWATSNVFLVLFSLILGMLVYWYNDPVQGGKKEKIAGFIFAFINSFAIAATVLGIDSTIS